MSEAATAFTGQRRGAIIAAGAATAVAGVAAMAIPALTPIRSFFLTDVVLFAAPFVGAAGFAALIVTRYARGWISGALLAIAGFVVYGVVALVTPFAAMKLAGLA
ncbi:MAG: hypothetical protein GC152_09040 [Alphaproteobacteria bacterium]|nr:hypothetical protein [Alphaproteobacteria bacterium]